MMQKKALARSSRGLFYLQHSAVSIQHYSFDALYFIFFGKLKW